MTLSPVGTFVETNLEGLEDKLAHLQVDEWEVMPDHVHLVLTLHPQERASRRVPTASRRVPTNVPKNGLRPLTPKSVESFINHFKGHITRWCHEQGYFEFEWQIRFHDRIIRDQQAYDTIMAYVQNNIGKWGS